MQPAQCLTEMPTRRRHRPLGLLVSALVTLAAILPSTAMAAGWTDASAGPLNVDRTNSVTGASLTDVGGVPYAGWAESTPDRSRSYVFAARYGGGAWEGVGGLIDVNGGAPQITTAGGVPYLAYIHLPSQQVYVDRLNNGVWTQIGGAPLAAQINDSGTLADWPSIAGDRHGVPYVAWSERSSIGSNSRVYVSAFVHGQWQSTTPGDSINFYPSDEAGYPRITNVNGTLWLTWVEFFSDGPAVEVARYNGTGWVPSGAPMVGTVGTDADGATIADVGGVPYIVWDDVRGGTRQIHVARYDPQATPNWVPVGGAVGVITPNDGGGRPRSYSITSVNGVPWVTWTETASGVVRVHVSEFAAGRWEPVFGSLNTDPTKNAVLPDITSVGGLPYASFLQDTTNDPTGPFQLHVVVPQRQMPLGSTSVSATPTQSGTKLAITLTGSADVRLDFTQRRPGHRAHGACVAPTKKNRSRPRCVRAVAVGTLRFHGHAGLNRVSFDGHLAPGRYQVRITATDAAGHHQIRSLTVSL